MRLQKTIVSIMLCCAAFVSKAQQTTAPLPVSKNGFIVIAHRGSHLVKPENTLAAIEAAIKEGADYVELDLRTTKDGHLMLCHDAKVDRTTNGKGLIKDLTWEEITKLTLKGNDNQVYRIPDFNEALKTCMGRINIYLDFKDADVPEAYRQIKAAGMEKNIVVYLNQPGQYDAWRKTAPAMPLMSSLPESIRTSQELEAFSGKIKLEVLDNVTDSTLLTATHANGISVWLDVQGADEGPAKWSEAINKGLQGIQTDHPEALVNYLLKNNLRNGGRAPISSQ
jgi:glycerophosphoryl diester phosphodiesterase